MAKKKPIKYETLPEVVVRSKTKPKSKSQEDYVNYPWKHIDYLPEVTVNSKTKNKYKNLPNVNVSSKKTPLIKQAIESSATQRYNPITKEISSTANPGQTKRQLKESTRNIKGESLEGSLEDITAMTQFAPFPLISIPSMVINSGLGLMAGDEARRKGDDLNQNINQLGAAPWRRMVPGLPGKVLEGVSAASDLTDNFGLEQKKNGGWLDNYGEEANANEGSSSAPKGWVGEGYSNVGRNYSPAWGGQFAMGGSIPGSVGFTYARTNSPAPSEGPYAKKTLPSAQDGKDIHPIDLRLPKYEEPKPFFTGYGFSENPVPNVNIHGVGAYGTGDINDRLNLSGSINSASAFYPGGEKMFMKPNVNVGLKYKFNNGGSMSYYQHGLDWKPRNISRNGGWLNKYVPEAQTGFELATGIKPITSVTNSGESTSTGVQKRDAKLENDVKVEEKKNKQAQISQGKANTPAQEAERIRKNKIYASTHPYAKIDEQGNLSAAQSDRTMEGKALPNTTAAGVDKGMGHMYTAMEIAGDLTGAGEMISLGAKALKNKVVSEGAQNLTSGPSRELLENVNIIHNPNRSDQLAGVAYDVMSGESRVGELMGSWGPDKNFISQSVEILPEFQGKGIGTKAYEQLAKSLPEGSKVVSSGMFNTNNLGYQPGKNLWESLVRSGKAVKLGEGSYKMLKKGGVIKDNEGYWNPDNWGEVVEIDSPYITMQGVNQPLLGISDTGDVQYMEPGQDYEFDGSKVREYPIPTAQKGKRQPIYTDDIQKVQDYGDSLHMHNTTRALVAAINKLNRTNPPHKWTSSNSPKKELDKIAALQSNNLKFRKTNPLYNPDGTVRGRSEASTIPSNIDYIDPIGTKTLSTVGRYHPHQPWRVDEYPNPVQPIIYKEPTLKGRVSQVEKLPIGKPSKEMEIRERQMPNIQSSSNVDMGNYKVDYFDPTEGTDVQGGWQTRSFRSDKEASDFMKQRNKDNNFYGPSMTQRVEYENGGYVPQAQKGKIVRAPIYTDNPTLVENYGDSLNLYNRSRLENLQSEKSNMRDHPTMKYVGYVPWEGLPNTLSSKDKKGHWNRFDDFDYNFKFDNASEVKNRQKNEWFKDHKIKPIGFEIWEDNEDITGTTYYSSAYKKPVQPYILEKEPKLKGKVSKVEKLPMGEPSQKIGITQRQMPNIVAPDVEMSGPYMAGYHDYDTQEGIDRGFRTAEERDAFVKELNNRPAGNYQPGLMNVSSYYDISKRKTKKVNQKETGGWLSQYK